MRCFYFIFLVCRYMGGEGGKLIIVFSVDFVLLVRLIV